MINDDGEEVSISRVGSLRRILKAAGKHMRKLTLNSFLQISTPLAKVNSLKFEGFLVDFFEVTKKCSGIRNISFKEINEYGASLRFSRYLKFCCHLLTLNLHISPYNFEDLLESNFSYDHLKTLTIKIARNGSWRLPNDDDDDAIEDDRFVTDQANFLDYEEPNEYERLCNGIVTENLMKFFHKLASNKNLAYIKLDLLSFKEFDRFDIISPLGYMKQLEFLDLSISTSYLFFSKIPSTCVPFCEKIECLTYRDASLKKNSESMFRFHVKRQPSFFYSKDILKILYELSKMRIEEIEHGTTIKEFFQKFKNLKFLAPISQSTVLAEVIKVKNIEKISIDNFLSDKRLNFSKIQVEFLKKLRIKFLQLKLLPFIHSARNLLSLNLIIEKFPFITFKKITDMICHLPETHPLLNQLKIYHDIDIGQPYSRSDESIENKPEENLKDFGEDDLEEEDPKMKGIILDSRRMYQASDIQEVFSAGYRKKAKKSFKEEVLKKAKDEKPKKQIRSTKKILKKKTREEKEEIKFVFDEFQNLPEFKNLQTYELKIIAPRHYNYMFRGLVNIVKFAKKVFISFKHPQRVTTQSRMPYFLLGDIFNSEVETIKLGEINKIKDIPLILKALRPYEKLKRITLDSVFFEFGKPNVKYWWSNDMENIPYEEIQDLVNRYKSLEECQLNQKNTDCTLYSAIFRKKK